MFKSSLDVDVDQAAEAELQRLQKQVPAIHKSLSERSTIMASLCWQLRKMDKDRRTFIDDRSRRHAKRQQIIDTLRAERNALRERVADQQTGPHARRTVALEHEMRALCERRDDVDRAYADKKLSLWQLDGNIRKMEKEIRHLQVGMRQ